MRYFGRIMAISFLICIMTGCESEKQQSEAPFQDEPSETVTEAITMPESPAPEPEGTIESEISENDVSRIDFNFFEDKLDSDTWNALQGYLPVLQGGADFTLSLEASDHEIASYENIKDKTDLHEFFRLNGETGNSITISQFSVFDLDSDGMQELIVCFDNLSGQYLVFHEENGAFYAAAFVYRGLQYLFPTGIYFASGGAGCLHWRTLAFEGGGFVEYELAGSDWNTDKACQEYQIDGEPVDEHIYALWEQEHFLQYSVPWYQPLENGKWCRKTYDYSEWGTDQEELL